MPATALQHLAWLGGRVRGGFGRAAARVAFVGAIVRALIGFPASAAGTGLRAVLDQLRLTTVHALPAVLWTALLVGGAVVAQAYARALALGLETAFGDVLVTILVRELAPLLTAVIVIARSGTATVAELATRRVLGEAETNTAGLDAYQSLVLPRVLGLGLAVSVLVLYFQLFALGGGAAAAALLGRISLPEFTIMLQSALTYADIASMLGKSVVLGVGIGTLCVFEGFTSGRTSRAVAQAVTRGVVAALVYAVTVSAVFSLARYA